LIIGAMPFPVFVSLYIVEFKKKNEGRGLKI
jgi:hypothetical protein